MPGSYGMYSTQQLPSLLSVQDILASEGPSIASPNPPVPAPLHKIQTRSEVENLITRPTDAVTDLIKKTAAQNEPESRMLNLPTGSPL